VLEVIKLAAGSSIRIRTVGINTVVRAWPPSKLKKRLHRLLGMNSIKEVAMWHVC
jgi:hypothetical protein